MPTLPKPWHIPWHLLIEKIPLLLLSRGRFRADRPHPGQCHPVAGEHLVAGPHRQCPGGLRELPGLFFLAAGAGRSLSASQRRLFGRHGSWQRPRSWRPYRPACLSCRRQAPYLLVGWLWYLGMLVPVIGLLQVGGQSMADRYTYLPQIGLVLGLVWAVTDLTDFLAARTAGLRFGGPVASSGARGGRNHRRTCRRRLATDGLLARQRNPLGPRHDVSEPRGPLQSRTGAGYRPSA